MGTRRHFDDQEKLMIEQLIKSGMPDEDIAKKMKCSKVTIKITRGKKYRILRSKRRTYSEETKRTMVVMYERDNMRIIDIARMMRMKYQPTWQIINKGRERPEKKPVKYIINRELFNYRRWLNEFLAFMQVKKRERDREAFIAWLSTSESISFMEKNRIAFNNSHPEETYLEKGRIL